MWDPVRPLVEWGWVRGGPGRRGRDPGSHLPARHHLHVVGNGPGRVFVAVRDVEPRDGWSGTRVARDIDSRDDLARRSGKWSTSAASTCGVAERGCAFVFRGSFVPGGRRRAGRTTTVQETGIWASAQ